MSKKHHNHVNQNWEWGMKSRVAERAGISKYHLYNILRGTRRPSPEVAAALEKSCKVYGIPLTKMDFLFNYKSKSPYFNLKF